MSRREQSDRHIKKASVKVGSMQRNASTIVGSFMDEIMLEGDDTNR